MSALAALLIAIPVSLLLTVAILVHFSLSMIWLLPIYAILGAVLILCAALLTSDNTDE
ncbi:hypothetical protein [Puniceibacterium sediminis]|uniref:Uncharacterized protein n=1 Tax=Puniceibacterium sediminis TaxID=1608407 RepID=A0A238WV92_9RHOB|nr:hypothetical protein [Puniceibacterium sediminis]SNR50363.1 hypothetical protein SAMN06265370_107161 [Puniceibacterium sediminis]